MISEITHEDIGKRVIYTDRNGKGHFGYLREITGPESARFCNVKIDGHTRERFYVPIDMVKLVPVELSGAIPEGDTE